MKLAVGFFDGVHVGHRRILSSADAALTFRNHPATVLAPERVPSLLMTSEDRLAAIDAALGQQRTQLARVSALTKDGPMGEDAVSAMRVRALDFTRTVADESPATFVDWLRATYPTCDTIVCGPNWRFGARGTGTAEFLRTQGFAVDVPAFAEWKDETVSSTRIRAALAAGELADVTAMLGHPWSTTGQITAGKGLGRQLGFPTINLQLPEGLVSPPYGVYALATPLGPALANWGLAPTLREQAWQKPVLEVHLLLTSPQSELMYQIHQFGMSHNEMRVEWIRFVRPERRFESLDELKAQIARDVAAV